MVPQIMQLATNATFSWYDYILFSVMLVLSVAIGLYFGCFGAKQSTKKDYLLGGRVMGVLPVGISLVASHVSGITLLALPADVYRFGAGIWLGGISLLVACILTFYIYLPVFFNMQITSTYEYLGRRFDERTQLLASFLFTFSVLLFLPIVVYIPSLAFSAATGLSVHLIAPIMCSICVFYTTIGGLKAVVWTDTLQFLVTVGAVAVVTILGIQSAGGLANVFTKAIRGGRLDIFDFDLDPTKRDSFWINFLGAMVYWIGATSVHQSCVLKFLSVPTLRQARWCVVSLGGGVVALQSAMCLTGLVIYAKYSDCDPYSTKKITRNDQLIPFYVMDVAKIIPGLSGLFIAGIFSAALSTLSATLNCLAGSIYEDFIVKLFKNNPSERTSSNILKLIVIVTGVVSTALVFVFQHLGGIMPLVLSLQGIANGPLLALFTLGMVFPKVNSKGAFYGAIVGMVLMCGIAFPAKYLETKGMHRYPPRAVSTDGCEFIINQTTFNPYLSHNFTMTFSNESTPLEHSTTPVPKYMPIAQATTQKVPFIFRISYYYYTLMGFLFTSIVALGVSYFSNKNDPPVDEMLISPVFRFMLHDRKRNKGNTVNYASVEKALNMMTTNDYATRNDL